MELLVAAAISGTGWFVSRSSGRVSDSTVIDRPESYPFAAKPQTSGDLLKDQQRVSDQRWNDAQTSETIVAANRPFFRSEKTQGTNPAQSQRRMELATGTLGPDSVSSTWKHKNEAPARFAPQPQPVMSGGSSGNSVMYDKDRQRGVMTHVQNNSLPFEKVYVGPGVGVGANVPAADGFHPQYRVLPVDPFAHKHNTLGGRTNGGASLVNAREADPSFYSKGVPRFYDMDRRPLEQSRAAVNGPSQREQFTRGAFPGCHVVGDEYFGTAGVSSQNVQAGGSSRSKNDDRPGNPLTNIAGQRAGIGAYTGAEYDGARFDSQRRESEQQSSGGMITGNARRPQAPNSFVTHATNRDLSLSAYTSGAKLFVAAGESRPGDMPQTTLKESLHDQSNGRAAAVSSVRAASVQCTNKQLLKSAKRAGYVANSYVTAPERTDAFRRANGASAHSCGGGAVGVRVRVNESRQMTHAASQSMYNNQALPGENTVLNRNKLPVQNTHTDFGIAREVLRGNDLAININ
jgi:hypothetical protein